MPYPNFHACRLKDPGAFQKGNWATYLRKSAGKIYHIIAGRLLNRRHMTEQAYRYPKGSWSAAEARAHCKEHGGRFEVAEGE